MELTKELIEKIYELLDGVSPVDFDCGKLCGEICCVYDGEDYANDDLIIYLLPGEEKIVKSSDNFELIYIEDAGEVKYPFSWKSGVYGLKCLNPPRCQREIRPIQCRTFPLIPHINKDDELLLIFDESEFPYECSLIHDNIELNYDFIQKTYWAWEILTRNKLVYDLISMDSRKRDNRRTDYEIIFPGVF